MPNLIFLYGAPASGKSTLAKALSRAAGYASIDLDESIIQNIGMPIADYFRQYGEEAFRAQENIALRSAIASAGEGTAIIALGGGTLLSQANRELCEKNGTIICLNTPDREELERRLQREPNARPLGDMAAKRAEHYASFSHRITRIFQLPDSLVLVGTEIAPPFLAQQRCVFDETVASLYPHLACNSIFNIPSGEKHKTPDTIIKLWHLFNETSLGRKECITACGGGVTGDLTGFSAATWMRGIRWHNIPTTLLAMVDASTGGKTACNLPEGKNLVGAFHSPELVVIDTAFLKTLPERELRSGYGEMLKHCIIGMKQKPALNDSALPSAKEIADSLAVKIDIVAQDPLETMDKRLILNCGHTVGHAIETASNYALSHGEAVAIGCIEEARLAVKLHLAPPSWPDELASCFAALNLPVCLPAELSYSSLIPLMHNDKKKLADSILFALPCGWGDVRPVKVNLEQL